jgi:hypothetical protein
MRSSVPDGPALPGWQRVGRLPDEREFVIGGKHGLRFYTPRRPRVRRDRVAEWLASERRPREMELGMAGNQQDWNAQPDVPGGRAESEAQVASGIAEAMQAVALAQGEARSFFESYGPAVSAGHSDVNAPGRMGDPDSGGADASDTRG